MKIGQTPEIPTPAPANTAAASNKPAPATKASPAQPSNAAATARSSATSAGVSVSVSTQARGLNEASAPTKTSDIDSSKVAAVKAAIQNGSYRINPQAIADKLLSSTQDLLQRPRN